MVKKIVQKFQGVDVKKRLQDLIMRTFFSEELKFFNNESIFTFLPGA